jgi:hypothetical protein
VWFKDTHFEICCLVSKVKETYGVEIVTEDSEAGIIERFLSQN